MNIEKFLNEKKKVDYMTFKYEIRFERLNIRSLEFKNIDIATHMNSNIGSEISSFHLRNKQSFQFKSFLFFFILMKSYPI